MARAARGTRISGSRLRSPAKWSKEDLRIARDVAERTYVAVHGPAGASKAFERVCAETEPTVVSALRITGDLRRLDASVLGADRMLWQTLRFFCGPPISEENLWTFVGRKFSGRLPEGVEKPTAEILQSALDRVRFPWISERRAATNAERRTAVVSTTVLIAHAQFITSNRGLTSEKQETAVHAALESAGFTLDSAAKTALDLKPGTFCKEKTIFNKKCDVPVRLRDSRLLTIECKVSNTPKNSWKRLNQETVGKSSTWREHLGGNVVTACVLAGVFDLACLVQAQEQGVAIFWQHDLAPLVAYLRT